MPEPRATRNPLTRKILAIFLIVASVAVSYAPAVRNGFVWDDTALVLRDPLIRSWRLIPEGFNHYLFVDATPSDFYRPLQRLTYTLEYAFFAEKPAAYHVTNIALHALAAIALMLFAATCLEAFGCNPARAQLIATVGALIWAIHPVHTAAVVYVSGRADPLAAVFGFTGCYLALRSLVRRRRITISSWFGTALAFLCSTLSKETGFVFPVLLGIILFVLQQRRALIWLGLVAIAVVVVYFSLRLPAEHYPVPRLGPETPLSVRPITIARAIAEYAGVLAFPINLHMERDVGSSFTGNLYSDSAAAAARELQTLLGIVLLAALLIGTVKSRRRDPLTFTLSVCGLIAYVPVSGLIKLNASVAEHWTYIPSVFLFLVMGLAGAKFVKVLFQSRLLLTSASVVFASWVMFLGTRTFIRTFDWKNQRTFLERTIAAGGNSARMLINLGSLESSESHLEIARKYLEEALKKEPDQPFALIDLAAVCIKQTDFATAHQLLGHATESPVVAGRAYELLAVLENKEKGQANLLRMRLAAHSGFPNWSTEKRYITLLAETGATTAAIQELKTCLNTAWYRADSWQLMGQLLDKAGQKNAAAEAFALANDYDVHLSAHRTTL